MISEFELRRNTRAMEELAQALRFGQPQAWTVPMLAERFGRGEAYIVEMIKRHGLARVSRGRTTVLTLTGTMALGDLIDREETAGCSEVDLLLRAGAPREVIDAAKDREVARRRQAAKRKGSRGLKRGDSEIADGNR